LDSIDAIIRATMHDVPGTFNVSGDGVLMLSQAIRRAGRVTLPIAAPLMPAAGRMMKQLGVADFSSEQVRYLTWGRVVDTTRMRATLGFEPNYTTVEAFDDFVTAKDLNSLLPPDRAAAIESTVVDLLGRGGKRSA